MTHKTRRYSAQPGVSLPPGTSSKQSTPRLARIKAATAARRQTMRAASRAARTRYYLSPGTKTGGAALAKGRSQFKYTPAKRFDGGPVLPKKV